MLIDGPRGGAAISAAAPQCAPRSLIGRVRRAAPHPIAKRYEALPWSATHLCRPCPSRLKRAPPGWASNSQARKHTCKASTRALPACTARRSQHARDDQVDVVGSGEAANDAADDGCRLVRRHDVVKRAGGGSQRGRRGRRGGASGRVAAAGRPRAAVDLHAATPRQRFARGSARREQLLPLGGGRARAPEEAVTGGRCAAVSATRRRPAGQPFRAWVACRRRPAGLPEGDRPGEAWRR
eukprot:133249-Chlamydomonas_euryale.AAC.3